MLWMSVEEGQRLLPVVLLLLGLLRLLMFLLLLLLLMTLMVKLTALMPPEEGSTLVAMGSVGPRLRAPGAAATAAAAACGAAGVCPGASAVLCAVASCRASTQSSGRPWAFLC